MRRIVLTPKFIASIKAAPGQRAEYWDAIVPSFGVRVTEIVSPMERINDMGYN